MEKKCAIGVFSEKTYLRVKIENLMYPFEDATYWLNLEFTLKYVFSENTPITSFHQLKGLRFTGGA
jgi:hypothetical protein